MLVLNNEAAYIRRDLAARILSLFFDDKLEEEIDAIPVHVTPKESGSMRCCIYKDRAMTRYRLMALLGISIELDDNELRSLKDFVGDALKRESIDNPVLTVIDMACSACNHGKYIVTELCRGCVARPCINSCPKNCIRMYNGRPQIDYDKCVKCGMCQKACAYNSIVYTPVPCEEKCPVDAIHKNCETGREEIDYSKCIYCGRCTRACPFGAVMERSQILDVAKYLKQQNKPVIAMVAPSIVGQFPGSVGQMVSALKQLGFSAVFEVAAGADKTAQVEALELEEKIDAGQDVLGTSCCPAYTETVNKHIPDFKEKVSHTPTPMSFTAAEIRYFDSNAISVFIGPCIAKKFEGINNKMVDYVLTYEELGSFLLAQKIQVEELEEARFESCRATSEARGFAVSSGVTGAVQSYYKGATPIKPLLIDGLNERSFRALKKVAKVGDKNINLVEVMCCEGGCICGPGVVCNPRISKKKLESYCKE